MVSDLPITAQVKVIEAQLSRHRQDISSRSRRLIEVRQKVGICDRGLRKTFWSVNVFGDWAVFIFTQSDLIFRNPFRHLQSLTKINCFCRLSSHEIL